MNKKRRLSTMLIPTIIMGLLAAILIFLAYQKGVHIQGLKSSGNMLIHSSHVLRLFSKAQPGHRGESWLQYKRQESIKYCSCRVGTS